jgi:hypothetical protein
MTSIPGQEYTPLSEFFRDPLANRIYCPPIELDNLKGERVYRFFGFTNYNICVNAFTIFSI